MPLPGWVAKLLGGRLAPRLLIIDDDPTLLRFLKEFFEREGFTVDSAAGGQPALRLFSSPTDPTWWSSMS
ncbi:MAG: hypothetical protein HW404_2291 [Anaerolineales bacterium]|nr:hypothetical protein [Anaerolineales bacterium]